MHTSRRFGTFHCTPLAIAGQSQMNPLVCCSRSHLHFDRQKLQLQQYAFPDYFPIVHIQLVFAKCGFLYGMGGGHGILSEQREQLKQGDTVLHTVSRVTDFKLINLIMYEIDIVALTCVLTICFVKVIL